MIKEINAKSALHKHTKKRLPYDWDLNIYRGCVHRCQYCYALYSHQYLQTDNNFFDEIYVKTNIIEVLERELASPKWKGDVINIGGVTDSYQAVEAEYKLMRDVLSLMIQYKNPIIISTKSDLILRDKDLLAQLAEVTYVNIAVTVTTVDETVRQKIEPFAMTAKKRLRVLEEFADTKVSRGLHVMPILPFITDDEANIDAIMNWAGRAQVDYVLTGVLNLVGKTKEHYMNFINHNYPEFYNDYLDMYKNWTGKKNYNMRLYQIINQSKKKYDVRNNFRVPNKKTENNSGQMKLF